MLHFSAYSLLLLLSAVVTGVVGTVSWRRRRSTPAAVGLAVNGFGLMLWAAAGATGLMLGGPLGARLYFLAIYPGIGMALAGFFHLCSAMAGGNGGLPRRTALLLSIEPLLVSLIALTNGWHGLLITELLPADSAGLPTARFGPLFWVHSAYSYGLLTWAFVRMVRAWKDASHLQRRQLGPTLVGASVPLIFNVICLLGSIGGGVDLTATGFAVTGVMIWWALFREGMLRLVPIARAAVLERVSDAVIVVDAGGHVLDANPAAFQLGRRIMPVLPESVIGLRLTDVVGEYAILRKPHHGVSTDGEYRFRAGGGQIDLDFRASRLTDRHGALIGHVIVARDITEANERKRALKAANAQLETANAKLESANGRLHEQLATIERLRADLAEQAVRDVLTGLHNRRYLMQMIEREVARATAAGDRVGVVLLDVDHFKEVNDRFGHAVGDRVLAATARMLTEHARAGDTVARYGGEEFVVLLPGATMEQALARANEWREGCAAVAVHTSGPRSASATVGITVSAGVASFPESGRSPEVLLQAADEALYAAKAAGRDRVLAARPGE